MEEALVCSCYEVIGGLLSSTPFVGFFVYLLAPLFNKLFYTIIYLHKLCLYGVCTFLAICGLSREIRGFDPRLESVCALCVPWVRIPLSPRILNFGGVAERLNAAVLKTVDLRRSGGSNPSPSAIFMLIN